MDAKESAETDNRMTPEWMIAQSKASCQVFWRSGFMGLNRVPQKPAFRQDMNVSAAHDGAGIVQCRCTPCIPMILCEAERRAVGRTGIGFASRTFTFRLVSQCSRLCKACCQTLKISQDGALRSTAASLACPIACQKDMGAQDQSIFQNPCDAEPCAHLSLGPDCFQLKG